MKDKKEKIIHVFHGLFYYLAKTKVYSFNKYCSDWDHQFVIYLPGKKYLDEFDAYFHEKEIPLQNVFYIKSVLYDNPDRARFMKRIVEFLDALKIYYFLWHHFRSEVKVFHGSTFFLGYLFMLIFNCRKVLFVCWSMPKGLYKKGTLRLKLKMHMFRKLGKINTLLSDDYKIMTEELHLTNVSCCSYFAGEYPILPKTPFSNRILIGNNGVFVDDYLKDLENMNQYLNESVKNAIFVGMMLNYGNASAEKRKELNDMGKSIFQDRYYEWTSVLPFEEYCRVMNTYDTYICSHETQSGLGAIVTMLFYGKKVFLSGYNLHFVQERGFVVFSYLDTLKEHPEEFVTPLTPEQIEINRRQYEFYYSPERIKKNWDDLFISLCS